MSDLPDGSYVNVRITNVRLDDGNAVIDEHGDRWPLPPHAEVQHVAPAEWPPQDQDIWEADGGCRFVADVSVGDPRLSSSRGTYEAERFLQLFGPVRLVLPSEDRVTGSPPLAS